MIGVLESVGGNVLARTLLDAVPSPVFLVDKEVRVAGYNAAAGRILGDEHEESTEFHDILECIQSPHSSTGSGQFVRALVLAAFGGQNSMRQPAVIRLTTPGGSRFIDIYLTATLVTNDGRPGVLLVIEEPVEPVPAKRLVPICSKCKKIRNELNRWENLEHYLRDFYGTRLTHGLCPDCLSNSLAQVGLEYER